MSSNIAVIWVLGGHALNEQAHEECVVPQSTDGDYRVSMSAEDHQASVMFSPPWEALQDMGVSTTVARPSVSDMAVSSLVGRNLRRLRKQHRWTLEDLSMRSGVSRAMLGQMEQGKSVPSIKTLWQIAQALRVSVDWFLEALHDPGVLLIRPSAPSAILLCPGEGELRPLHLSTDGSGDEFHELRLAPHAKLSLPASQGARRVNVAVSAGELEFVIDGTPHRVHEREALQWDGSDMLTWHNPGLVEVQAFVVLRPIGRTF
jgi:transcriptional regulator with XRE-family HTH domain